MIPLILVILHYQDTRWWSMASACSTRGLWCAGEISGSPTTRVIIFVPGNAIDFGGGVYSRYAGTRSKRHNSRGFMLVNTDSSTTINSYRRKSYCLGIRGFLEVAFSRTNNLEPAVLHDAGGMNTSLRVNALNYQHHCIHCR